MQGGRRPVPENATTDLTGRHVVAGNCVNLEHCPHICE
jgi:hypothetical protein